MFGPNRLGVANVCNLLDLMWTNAIKTKLNIPAKDLPQYAVALVVRDTINRKEVAEMVRLYYSGFTTPATLFHLCIEGNSILRSNN